MTASAQARDVLRSTADHEGVTTGWGHLAWLFGAGSAPVADAEQTFGVVTILPGERNPLHLHPNCEELLYVVAGTCDHLLDDTVYHMTPGSVIRVPRGVPHWARCTSETPLTVVVSFSSPNRETTSLEGDDLA